MTAAINFTLGTIVPYDPNYGIPYGMEPVQKWNSCVLDSYFLDSVTGARCSRAITVGVDGNVNVTFADGTSNTLYMIAGVWYPMKVYRVNTSGTTASSILWGY